MCADPDQQADNRDDSPQAKHRSPVEHAIQAATCTASRFSFAARLAHAWFSRRRRGVVVTVIVPALRGCFPGLVIIAGNAILRGKAQFRHRRSEPELRLPART